MIGFYDYTVLLTYLSFLSSFFGIILAFDGKIFYAIMCLMFSGLCDMFDGRVARTKKRRTNDERNYGMQIDSLSDLVCFGVLPALIGYNLGLNKYFIILLMFYSIAALIRLAYFNMLEMNRNSKKPVKEYTGLPVTSAALIFPFIYMFRSMLGSGFMYLYAGVLLIVGCLFISKIKIKKPSMKVMIGFILIGVIELILIITIRKLL
ncbi:MAG: CDP-alcohol phosphatidyltransferase family protein [Bacilli bacterium]|nr:CDP-alcohol phosphatidyltransferase family protein [Bacilli bacterium]